ncbi:phosphatidylinositol phosphate kinase [Chloropicon primus]|uniref:1-phosphatidylinositol-3-phosphate 5-kinase n=1 Tax=Chloropicon primus TaxID=1764295 RepID=A0A5B8MU63_9CHLO|nr:phosphatidylinositol phosphate kinase [Chloropicon primus]|eukprot:QDZ23907.1 phosphatidylinositol phosphate kinase [Chloropicon primus]
MSWGWKGVKGLFKGSGGEISPRDKSQSREREREGVGGTSSGAPGDVNKFWIDDKLVRVCYECDVAFTLFNRRHHCRKCGKVFCSKCASNTIPSVSDTNGETQVRVCNYCYQLYLERPDAYSKFRPAVKRVSMSHRLTASAVDEVAVKKGKGKGQPRAPGSGEKAMAAVLEEHRDNSGSFGDRREGLASSPLAINGKVASTPKDASKPSQGREVTMAGSYVEHASSSWAPMQDGPGSMDRAGSAKGALGSSSSQLQSANSCSYGNETILEEDGGSGGKKDNKDLLALGIGSEEVQDDVWSVPSQVLDLTADIGENSLQVKLFRYLQKLGNEFEALAGEHLKSIIRTLLAHHSIDSHEEWLDIIQETVTRAAANIDRLEMPGNAPQDPRDYIKVKRVGSGKPSDSYLVKGLVFSKNIAHRRMPSDIKSPKILLLGCAVEYERMQNRLSSVDILLEQEREHLRLSVARILQYRPTLIFVEKTVARNAQELLLQAGVTLVLKVKPSLMNHISRLTGSDIVQNLADIRPDNFGTCDHFYVKTFKLSPEEVALEGKLASKTKTLLFLDGCPYKAGCSIILKGSSLSSLLILKKIITFGVYAAYHHKIECKFLPLQCISAWNPASTVTSDKLVKGLRQSYDRVRDKNAGCEISISPFMLNTGSSREGGHRGHRESSDIGSFQHFFVSLASRCPSRGLLCEAPSVHDIAFYESSDVSLVRFLRAALPEPNRHCPHPRCGDGPSKHIRAYVSGNYCVTLTVKELADENALPGKEANVIWAWRQGPHEAAKDCIRVPMTLEAGQISLGIFLQYFFAAPTLKGPDGHRLNNDFACYFGIGKGIARFTCEKIKPLGVYLPPIPMTYNAEIDDKWLINEGSEVLSFCEDIFGRIENMIGRVKHKIKSSTSSSKEEYVKIKELEEEVKQERQSLEAFVSPKSRSLINFGELSQLKVFEMNRVRKKMVIFASSCISKTIYINDGLSAQTPGHSRQKSLLGNWLEQVRDDVLQNGSKGEAREKEDPSSQGLASKKSETADNLSISHASSSGRNANSKQSQSQSLQSMKSATDPIPHFKTLNTSALSWSGRFTLPQSTEEKVVAVFDDEPTSLIGYVLMSNQYHERLEELKQESLQKSVENMSTSSPSAGDQSNATSQDSAVTGSDTAKELILSEDTTHIRHSFEDFAKDGQSKVHFQVTVYYATQFQEIRRLFGKGDETFIHSLLRCKKWETKGGKSNAYFAKTLDDRFVVKQMSKTEISSFLTFAPSYFRYMNTKLDSTKERCCLAKIFGVYQVVIKHPSSAGGASKDIRLDVMIMENIFYAKAISRIYDLKGSIRSRYNAEPTASNAVLLDENLLEILPASPILVEQDARAKLERSMWKDTSFLAQLGVMDYSLLVGIDEINGELVVGIIDYIRQYTWDKQLETWVKSSGILGGAGKVPTIISPKQYMKRFRIAMMVYFTLVPSDEPPEDSLDPEAM